MEGQNATDRAIIVVDMLVDFVDHRGAAAVPGAGALLPLILGELQYFRERGRAVVFGCTELPSTANYARAGTKGAAIVPQLTPRPGELVVTKRAPSVFFGTELQAYLKKREVQSIVLVGVSTNTGILLSAADALSMGYEVAVPETCVCAADRSDHDWALHQIRQSWLLWVKNCRLV